MNAPEIDTCWTGTSITWPDVPEKYRNDKNTALRNIFIGLKCYIEQISDPQEDMLDCSGKHIRYETAEEIDRNVSRYQSYIIWWITQELSLIEWEPLTKNVLSEVLLPLVGKAIVKSD